MRFPGAYATRPNASMRGGGLFPEEALYTHLRDEGVAVAPMPKDTLHFSSLSVGADTRIEYVFRQESCDWAAAAANGTAAPCDCHGQGLDAGWLAHGERARRRAIKLLGLSDPYA